MQTLARLFGRSPFAPLQTHMDKVAVCVHEVPLLFEAVKNKDYALVEIIAARTSKSEHDADLTKNDIRNHLPTGLFLPIARGSILEILSLQDNIADRAEDTAILLTFRNLEISSSWSELFFVFLEKSLETFEGVYKIIKEMGQLLETSFGGSEAEKVCRMVEEVAYKEHETDVLQRTLLKKFFLNVDDLPAPSFYLWMKVIHEIASISDEAEKLANRVRMTLEVK